MLCALAGLLLAPASDAARVLVLMNQDSPASVAIATEYSKRRSVKQVLKVRCQDSALSAEKETIPFDEFQIAIEKPLNAYLAKHPEVDFIVTTKGIPIRIAGADTGMGGNRPSLDSYLASIDYRKRKDVVSVTLNDSGFTGKCWANRYWNSEKRFTHRKFGGYLVTRLDAYTPEEARELVSRSLEATRKPVGMILLDSVLSHGLGDVKKVPLAAVSQNASGHVELSEMNYNDWDADLVAAGERLKARNLPVMLDRTDTFIGGKSGIAGYASWGSNDPKFSAENYLSIRFGYGAITETTVSTSARTFLPTTGGQSLIADLLRQGATGAKGYCDEPLLQAVASPTILFDRYTRGWTLAESFYAASRYVGWEDIVVGDPLCAPYR